MEETMANKKINIYVGATAMRTCLGDKNETLVAMRSNVSGLKYNDTFKMYVGSSSIKSMKGFTRFESMVIEQISNVLLQSGLHLSNEDCQLVISTTKGNVELLADNSNDIPEQAFLYTSAQTIADYFNSYNQPIVISNACISGVSAFVIARDRLLSGACKHAIVVGCDVLSEFITSGFASFKSVSSNPCKPYDAERDGLTLGEACGAVVLSVEPTQAEKPYIYLSGGAISNDANHISGPSRTGDGLYYAMMNALAEAGVTSEDVGFVNAHGTATRYNDEMESKAIAWAGLALKPLNGIKGYIGHTLGASGVVEAIVCMEELRLGFLLGTKNLIASDASWNLKVSPECQRFTQQCCLKTASGFGGCNAAIVLDMKMRDTFREGQVSVPQVVAHYQLPASDRPFAEYIRTLFKSLGEDNMKFYKMSDMSKALYVAVEKLLAIEGFEEVEPTRRAIILANRSASLDSDWSHQQILNKRLPEGTSPAVFVYTLPNVSAGEICIRHKMQGDNTFFIENQDSGIAERYARSLIVNNHADVVICGWCEYLKGHWNVNVKLLKKIYNGTIDSGIKRTFD